MITVAMSPSTLYYSIFRLPGLAILGPRRSISRPHVRPLRLADPYLNYRAPSHLQSRSVPPQDPTRGLGCLAAGIANVLLFGAVGPVDVTQSTNFRPTNSVLGSICAPPSSVYLVQALFVQQVFSKFRQKKIAANLPSPFHYVQMRGTLVGLVKLF